MDLLRVYLTSLLFLVTFFSTAAFTPAEAREALQDSQPLQRISELGYQLTLSISDKPEFSAASKLEFNLVDSQTPLILKLNQAQIHSFIINGHKIYPNYDGQHIKLNQRLLNNGSNTIEMKYSGTLAAQGRGLNRFVDSSDNQVYLYSDFNEGDASQLLPQFDQAALKASFQFNVSAPKNWTVVTTMRETKIIAKGAFNLWQFPAGPNLSIHQLPLFAGPFQIWQDNTQAPTLRLLSRQSIKEAVDASLWLSLTKTQLIDFTQRFGTPYPYQKYDQIISPVNRHTSNEVIADAGVSSVNEVANRASSSATKVARKNLISSISYGLAWQWLTGLTDHYWYQDGALTKDVMLDSLAIYMTTQALADTEESPLIWRDFYVEKKRQVYVQDNLRTAHHNTGEHTLPDPFKGVAILKQLAHQFDNRTFELALAALLQPHDDTPVTLEHLITKLGSIAKQDLSHWEANWLQQVGVNSIKVDFSCTDNRITTFSLLQSPASDKHNELREQKVTLALYTKGRNQLHRNVDVVVTYRGAKTDINRLIGVRCPDLVYPNDHDWGYVKVVLDEKSINTAKLEIHSINDPYLKSMLWQALWESVLSGALPLDQYLGAVFVNLPQEQDIAVLMQVLPTLMQSKAYLNRMHPIGLSYTRKALKGLEQMSLRKSMFYQDNPELQQIWFNAYIQFSSSDLAIEHLIELIEGTTRIYGLTLDQNTRWKMIRQINRYDHIESKNLLLAEQKKDVSPSAENASLAALVSRPEANMKRRWLARIHSNERFDDSTLETLISHLYPDEQKQLSAITSPVRIDKLAELDNRKSAEFMQVYAHHLIPTQCDHRGITMLEKALVQYSASNTQDSDQPKLSTSTYNALLNAHQEEIRCVIIKERLLTKSES